MIKAYLERNLAMAPSKHQTYEARDKEMLEFLEYVPTSGIHETPKTHRFNGVVIGMLVGFKDSNEPLVNFPANTSSHHLPARSAVVLGKNEIGREVALLFEGGDPCKP